MFTGLIDNLGIVQNLKLQKSSGILLIKPKKMSKIKIGESIAVNGCCLTVTSVKKNILEFDISDETIRKTNLKDFQKGDLVNLERALKREDSFGGHFVLGHIDGVGKIKDIQKTKGSLCYTVSYPKRFLKFLIEKGSVSMDGISLTVCDLTRTNFKVFVIPHTWRQTNLQQQQKGEVVNLEFDVLGKYVLKSPSMCQK